MNPHDHPGLIVEGDMMSRLMETAKTGQPPSREEVETWLKAYDLSTSGQWESDFYRVLSMELAVSRGATNPNEFAVDSIKIPPEEQTGCISPDIFPLVKECLAYKDWTLIEEMLRILKSQQKTMHPLALPGILDEARHQTKLHDLLLQTLGERSRWLAQLNPNWEWWSELQEDDGRHVSSKYLLNWMLLQHKKGNTISVEYWQQLSTKDQKFYLDEVATNPNVNDVLLANDLMNSRSAQEKFLGMTILLKIDSEERKILLKEIQPYCKESITIKKGKLFLDLDKNIDHYINNKWTDIAKRGNAQIHPFLTIIQFFRPEEIYLESPKEDIIAMLFKQNDLPLLPSNICGIANFYSKSTWGINIIQYWLFNYSQSSAVNISPLLEKMTYAETQLVLEILIDQTDDYFIEKLHTIMTCIDHYIRKDLSGRIIDRIFEFIFQRINRRDLKLLIELLPHLQYLLDPRVYSKLVSQWQEVDYRHQNLSDALWELRNVIKLRQSILTTIIN